MKKAGNRFQFCGNTLASRSKFAVLASHRCFHFAGHKGRCAEYPFLDHFASEAPKVRQKIIRDATMTTGAAWASEDAGPNRIQRWVMLLSDAALLEYGIKMADLDEGVVAKLREKAADYESCMSVARKLTAHAYGMDGAPSPPPETRDYLETVLGEPIGPTICQVCRLPLSFSLFAIARRGRAAVETAHANPRLHTPENIGFAHRECNIAQGAKTLSEFHEWILEICARLPKKGVS